ncbi:MAG: hypothetical protein WDO24_22025 [Pseudomonadota bacterium]
MIRVTGTAWVAALLLVGVAAPAQAQHQQHGHADKSVCNEPTLACATAATPYLAADGRLWLAWVAGGQVSVARSDDRGKSFTPAVAVTPEPAHIDTGPTRGRASSPIARDGCSSPTRCSRTRPTTPPPMSRNRPTAAPASQPRAR